MLKNHDNERYAYIELWFNNVNSKIIIRYVLTNCFYQQSTCRLKNFQLKNI